jgi:hypothetical protein
VAEGEAVGQRVVASAGQEPDQRLGRPDHWRLVPERRYGAEGTTGAAEGRQTLVGQEAGANKNSMSTTRLLPNEQPTLTTTAEVPVGPPRRSAEKDGNAWNRKLVNTS